MRRHASRCALLTVLGRALLLVPLACVGDRGDDPVMLEGPLTMTVSGGIAGLTESVEVTADGTVTRTRGRTRQTAAMADDELERLATIAESGGVFEADREHRSRGADMRTYTLSYRGVTVVCDDGAMPTEVAEVVGLLEAAATE